MKSGDIVEYIENQKVICALILDVKDKRLRLLNENNREVNLSINRLSHLSQSDLKPALNRHQLVESLKEMSLRRKSLIDQIDIKELWEVLEPEQESIDLKTMTELCFASPTADHESAVVRAFFENRTYFKFNHDNFTANSPEQVEQIIAQKEEQARKQKRIEEGGKWLKQVMNKSKLPLPRISDEIIEILKSYHIFGKESPHKDIGKAMLAFAGMDSGEKLFRVLVKLGEWDKNENLDLYRYHIPIDFPSNVTKALHHIEHTVKDNFLNDPARKDLTHLPLMTIDGRSTLDFDDALSIEKQGLHYKVGIHIVDVSHYVEKGSPIDQEGFNRGSSIYFPETKIPMLPSILSEDLCSLKQDELRPAMTVEVLLDPFAQVVDYEVFPSIIRVRRQLTYFDTETMAHNDEEIKAFHELAIHFRQKRISSGATQISLPEVNVWLAENGDINLRRMDRESPGRMLVAEMMILANWLMAKFLSENNMPAVFRSQPEPKERILKNDQGTLFENWMQRKMLSRGMLGTKAEFHSGLGLNAYITATSPIRKYYDLVTQRQIRAVHGYGTPYTEKEIQHYINTLEDPIRLIGRIQYMRHRYWILKYLEGKTGSKTDAIIVDKRRNFYIVMIPEYMLECKMTTSGNKDLKPGDLIQITIQHANARNDTLAIFMG